MFVIIPSLFLALSTTVVLPAGDSTQAIQYPRSYCGVHCIYGAAIAVHAKSGRQVEMSFVELLNSSFVSSFKGSSNRDLEQAADFLGVQAKTHRNLSWRSLEQSTSPMILHVRMRGSLEVYNHWILFLGVDDSRAIVRDGRGGDIRMEPTDLMSRWDGTAISVFGKGEPIPKLIAIEGAVLCGVLSLIGVCVTVISRLTAYSSLSWRLAAYIAFCIAFCLFTIFWRPIPWTSERIAKSLAFQAQNARFSEISYLETRHRSLNEKWMLIDCRFQKDFDRGAIQEAINIPVDCNEFRMREIAESIPVDKKLVLYCLSDGCMFSDVIAAELTKLGDWDISIYRNGYQEWTAMNLRQ